MKQPCDRQPRPKYYTNPQNNASKADNEIYAKTMETTLDYVEFASENYGDGNLADTTITT
ncbi:hypothetical protein BSPWISOXPB_4964 [uncultured Gammaproteobacteria bacterium]|nr:hypothetical protein BSPWISOXPB_4964 [uncultured Gammaproteobacteria bacterium]